MTNLKQIAIINDAAGSPVPNHIYDVNTENMEIIADYLQNNPTHYVIFGHQHDSAL